MQRGFPLAAPPPPRFLLKKLGKSCFFFPKQTLNEWFSIFPRFQDLYFQISNSGPLSQLCFIQSCGYKHLLNI